MSNLISDYIKPWVQNPRGRFACTTKLCTVTTNICGSMLLISLHPSGACDFKIVPRYLENFSNLDTLFRRSTHIET